jgi:hypothetical protein
LDEWLQLIEKTLGPKKDIPIILLGLTSGMEDDRKVSYEDGLKITKSKGLDAFFECNLKTRENVHNAFETLAYLIMIKKEKFEK